MRNLYYYLTTVVFFLAFVATNAQPGCNSLEITATQDGAVCGSGMVKLEATSSGTGDGVFWYDAATGGDMIGQGNTIYTPEISTTTSYWAAEANFTGGTATGLGKVTNTANAGYAPTGSNDFGVVFTATQSFTLTSVEVLSSGSGGSLDVELRENDTNGNIIESATVSVVGGGSAASPIVDEIVLNFDIPGPGTYYLAGFNGPNMIRDTGAANNSFPYSLGAYGEITSGHTWNGSFPDTYYFFYNWTIGTLDVVCESPRVEAIATVNNIADEDIATLPYTHTANTSSYDNNYAGEPGSDCGTGDEYLYGYDVVYKYTADNDYILQVDLTNVSENYTGIFVYEDCADIGDECAAEGSVSEIIAGHGFQMSVENGKDYYFVVSSAEPTDSFDYTLTINGTTCANYPAPTANATQDFVDGQLLSDLTVSGLDLTWYSDAALTNVLPEDTPLVDNTTYYVTQTFQTCESAYVAITVSEMACTALDVLSTTANSVCGEGSVILTAEGAEAVANTNIYWYDAATGGEVVGKGTEFKTDPLEQTTSFWATEVALSGGGELTGQAKPTHTASSPSGYTLTAGVEFTATEEFTITSVEAYSNSTAGGVIPSLQLQDGSGQMIQELTNIVVPAGGTGVNAVPFTIELNFDVPGAGIYRLMTNGSHPSLIRDSGAANNVYPYLLGDVGEITSGVLTSSTSTSYYYFYNWTIGSEDVLCESDRVEVIAEVNDVADEMVTTPLPYVHTANTADYGNNYFGTPGSNCATDNYLDGNDVVYQFSPTVGAVYSIELSGLSSNNVGVFIYESCYNIGTDCYIGAISDGSSNDFGIDEVALNDGQDYFIVISTETSSQTDYTITIDMATVDCADYTSAPEGDDEQIHDIGSTLADLNVKGANLIWYSDSSLGASNVLPSSTVISNGNTYYVTQTLNGCESDYLEVTVYELDCSALEILSTTGGAIVCKGSATIEAVGNGGVGTEIYWFDSETSDNRLHKGASFPIPEITTTTSYWVAEVAVIGGELPGQAKEEPTGTSSFGSTLNYGLQFDAYEEFLLSSVDVYPTASGELEISLFDSTGSLIDAATQNVSSSTDPVSVELNFNVPIGNGYRLLQTSNPSISLIRDSSGNSFPYDLGINGELGQITNGTYGTSSTNSSSYYYFYNWTLGDDEVVCESTREEVIVDVSQDGNEIVGTLPYSHSENTGTYGNNYSGTPGLNCGVDANYLNGSDVVYMFEATEDDLITIELTDLNQYYAGVFVYEVCGEIGDECAAGAVAGPGTDDVIIQDFPVVDGQTYYIVVSSWLTTDIDYTIKINSFSCADLETPTGDATQDFVAGDTVDDLEAEGTRTGAVLTWYEDAALTIEITDTSTHLLVDADTYYVTQTFNECESPALAITAEEIDCSSLEIVSFTDGEVSCRGSVQLQVVASGTGSEVYWYDAATGGEIVGRERTFTTPELTQTTSYWAAEVYTEATAGSGEQLGPVDPTIGAATGSSIAIGTQRMYFDVFNNTILESVDIFPTASVGSSGSVVIRDSNQNVLYDIPYTTTVTGGTTPQTVMLNAALTPGTDYEIGQGTAITLMRNSSGAVYPYTSTDIEITGNSFSTGYYYWYYNWTLAGGDIICESPRQEVVATVNQSGDIAFDYTDLTYVDANNTAIYGNNFTGDAGDGCDGANYLNGSEAMYYYTANPTDDDILRIEVSNFSNPNTAVFVYESCGDVGIDCLAGATNDGGEIVIEDYYVNAGEDLLIVVTSSTGSTDYTLTVEGLDCNNVAPPTGDAAPYFITGDMVSDLQVSGSAFNDGFVWYNDAALTNEIVDPTAEPIVNGNSYFVTQTILGCESVGFEIVPIEFDCGLMGVNVLQSPVYICSPGGDIVLNAESTGVGSEVFWYDAEFGGNYLGKGTPFTFDADQNSSIWASEVYLAGEAYLMGQGKVNPTGTSSFGSTLNYGLKFDVVEDFNLHSVDVYPNASGNIEISLFDSSGNLLNSKTQSVTSSVNDPVTVILDFNVPVGTDFRLLQTSDPSIALVRDSSGNDFPYDLGVNGQYGQITFGTYGSSGTLNSSSYYYFYNWVIGEQDVICESSREEIRVVMNEDVTPPPVVTPKQTICGESLLSDIIVLGTDIRWYDGNGSELSPNSPVVEGYDYFVTQTIRGCESAMTEVIMDFTEKSSQPVAAINQAFESGEDLTDLEVFGDNLTWYADRWKVTPIAPTTLLEDQTTYYVTQTLEDMCESEPLGITVHEILDVKDLLFESFAFYPNPVDDVLFITNAEVIDEIEIFDLSGRLVYSNQYTNSSIEVDVTRLSTGTYLMKAKVDDMEKIFRVIKK